MKNLEVVNQLENRIEELEYRIAILEKYLDTEDVLLAKYDRSTMDSIRIWVMGKLKQKGYMTNLFKDRLGKHLYLDN